MSRQDLLLAATLMLAVDVGLASSADGLVEYALKAAAYWIGGVGVIKRLHDVGRSGWWLLGGAAAVCIWAAVIGLGIGFTVGLESLQPGTLGYIALLAAVMLPALGMTLWLHLTSGEVGINRFGPEPEGILSHIGGMASPGETIRR